MPQTKTFTKKTVVVFTTIEIEKSGLLRTSYTARFKLGKSKDNLNPIEVYGLTLQNCLDNLMHRLDCEIDERHYIIK